MNELHQYRLTNYHSEWTHHPILMPLVCLKLFKSAQVKRNTCMSAFHEQEDVVSSRSTITCHPMIQECAMYDTLARSQMRAPQYLSLSSKSSITVEATNTLTATRSMILLYTQYIYYMTLYHATRYGLH